jgi:3-mercaptopyruvate sulfurtransferase SseA
MKKITMLSIMAAAVLFTGCGSSNSDSNYTPETDLSYSSNKAGVIEASTLTSYIDDWKANRPENAKGRLVIIQAGATSNGKFIKHNEAEDVVVYQIPGAGACNPSYMRHDGVANIPGALLSGQHVDGMINMFHLDPKNDYVVFALGEGSTGIREIIRSWWVLTYWGWNDDRLAFLNGSVSYDFSQHSGLSDYLVDSPTTPPATPSTYSVKELATDRTDLHIYIKEMMDIAEKDDKSGYFIADARGSDEYNGIKKSKTLDKNCGVNHDEQCYSPIQGHIRGAVDFPYTDILVMDDQVEDLNGDGVIDAKDSSFKFKTKSELKALYAEKGYKNGDKVITYCRTGRKATLIALTSYAVLKYPVAMYDGSWIQWGEMASAKDVNGTAILPSYSPWRTDTAKYSTVEYYVDPSMTQSAASYMINNIALNSNKIRLEDKAYLGF